MMKKKEKKVEKKAPTKIRGNFVGDRVVSNSPEAFSLYERSRFGEKLKESIYYTLLEALYLVEEGRLSVYKKRRRLSSQDILKLGEELEKNFFTRYRVFADLRRRGYIVKTAFKFGADFRVYEKGVKPGEAHAVWLAFPVYEGATLTWHDFAAKSRVAHSTRKRLLICIVDDEGDVTYYEAKWLRP